MAVLKRNRGCWVGLAALAWLAATGAAGAADGTPLDAALARAFPGARVERRTLALSPEDVRAVESLARARDASRLVTAYVAWRGDTLSGVAFTDRRVVRTREAVLFLVVAPDTTIERIEALAFFEPPDYRPAPRWLERFRGRRAGEPREVPGVAGATLTSRAVNEAARLALARYERLLAPALGRRATNPAARRPMGGDQP